MVQATVFRTIVALNGSPRSSSRTAVLVQTIAQAVALLIPAKIIPIHLSDVAPHVLPALSRDQVKPEGEAILRTIESADLLVVGTPVYRASLVGALKHIFDLIDCDALGGRVALLSATGGTALHGLVGEHQLRPLLSFFRVFTTPTFVYGTEDEFTEAKLPNPGLVERAERAAEEAAFLLTPRVPAREPFRSAL